MDVDTQETVEVGQLWRLKDSEPWNPTRYEVTATEPGWVRLRNIDPATYWMQPRGVKLSALHSRYERDTEYEAAQLRDCTEGRR